MHPGTFGVGRVHGGEGALVIERALYCADERIEHVGGDVEGEAHLSVVGHDVVAPRGRQRGEVPDPHRLDVAQDVGVDRPHGRPSGKGNRSARLRHDPEAAEAPW